MISICEFGNKIVMIPCMIDILTKASLFIAMTINKCKKVKIRDLQLDKLMENLS